MTRSWDEFNTDHKTAPPLESLVQRQDRQTAIACRLCKQVFFGKKNLVIHVQSHLNPDRNFNPNSLVRSFAPPENGIRHNTNHSHSFSAPLNTCNLVENEMLGSNAWQTFVPNQFKLSLDNSLVSPPSKKSVHLTFRHQPYPSPSVFRSAMNHGILGSRPNGSPKLSSPIGPITPAMFNSEITEGSNFCYPVNQSNFYPPAIVDKASQLFAGTSDLGRGKSLQVGMENIVVGPLPAYTKPYIKQLEQPIKEILAGHNGPCGDNDGDELDLTLKL